MNKFNIEISPAGTYSRKWSDYAEGFSSSGAIFNFDESGGKKVHRDDSIVPGREYYVVSRQFSCPYGEVNFQTVGTLRLRHTTYQVYTMTANVSLDNEQRYSQISDFFRRKFGVGFLETAPEIIPLWPPVVEKDVLVPTKDSRIYCAIKSGNDVPSVYSYIGNYVSNIPIYSDQNGEKHIFVKASQIDTVLSVDRKYVGREIVFRLKDITSSTNKYEHNFLDDQSNIIPYEELNSSIFSKGGIVTSNAKIELFLGSADHTYLHLPVRSNKLSLPSFQNLSEVLFSVDGGIVFSHTVQPLQAQNLDSAKAVEAFQNSCRGVAVPVPRWVHHLITRLNRNDQELLATAITKRMTHGKLPIEALRLLDRIYRMMGDI